MNKNALEVNEIFEILSENSRQFKYQRDASRKAEVNTADYGPQIAHLTSLVQQLIPIAQVCAACANNGHSLESCPSLGGYRGDDSSILLETKE